MKVFKKIGLTNVSFYCMCWKQTGDVLGGEEALSASTTLSHLSFAEALGNIQPKQGVLVPPTAVGAWAFPANATSVYLRSCCHGST